MKESLLGQGKFYRRDALFPYLCILPALAGLMLVVFIPIVKAIYMSFMDYRINTTAAPAWNSFQNYIGLFKKGQIFTYLGNTAVYMVSVVTLQFVFAIIIALLLNQGLKGQGIFRSLFLLPWVIPSIVTAILFSWLFNPQFGAFNYLLTRFGLQTNPNQMWLQNPGRAMICVVIASVWKNMPYTMVMMLAGFQSVDVSLIEAAKIDGAGASRIFFRVMLPSIRPILDSTLVIAVIETSQMFTIIYNMTGGGPLDRTMTFSLAAYNKAFVEFNLGSGSALGVIWLVLMTLLVSVYKYFSDKNAKSYL